MSVDNKRFFQSMKWVVRLLIALILFDLFLSLLKGSLSDIFPNHELAIVSLALLLILGFLRFSFFSYEDEYEIIHIDTRSLVFGFLESPKHKHYEFAKNILADYSIQKGFLKYKVIITVNSSTGDKKLRRFDLYFLDQAKRDYVENSLKKVLEHNRK
jgi:general stress protein CsbA